MKKYYRVSISGKQYLVHTLIAATFLDVPDDYDDIIYIINHKDNDGTNNAADNLEYATYSENNKHAVDLGLCHNKPVFCYKMDGTFVKEYHSVREAARDVGTGRSNISWACIGMYNHKSSMNFQWRFKIGDEIPGSLEAYTKHTSAKQVSQYDFSGTLVNTYESTIAAGKAINEYSENIASACRGEMKYAYGYQWRYTTAGDIPNKIGNIMKPGVIMYDKDRNVMKIYQTKVEIMRKYGISKHNLNIYIEKNIFWKDGITFEMEEDLSSNKIYTANQINNNDTIIRHVHNQTKIVLYDCNHDIIDTYYTKNHVYLDYNINERLLNKLLVSGEPWDDNCYFRVELK